MQQSACLKRRLHRVRLGCDNAQVFEESSKQRLLARQDEFFDL